MPGLNEELAQQFTQLNKGVFAFRNGLYGNPAKNKIGEKTKPTLGDRMQVLGMNLSQNNYGPTPHVQRTREIFEKQFAEKRAQLQKLQQSMQAFADAINAAGGPQVEGFYWFWILDIREGHYATRR